jgi:Ca-activated chloride channel family protein
VIKFAHPEHFVYFLAIVPLAAVFWYAWFRKRHALRRYGSDATVLRMIPGRSRVKFWLRSGLLLVASASFVLASANPQIGTKFEEVKRSGIDLIVAVDVSASMLAEDIKPNRMEAAKREIANLINDLKGDRIGIIVFAGDAYSQLPLTTDYNAALLLSDVIAVGIAPRPGTAIGSAIELARKSFAKNEGKYKALVIITDGENHEDDPVASARDAEKEGVVIHTIGMGLPEGAPIPIVENGQTVGFKTDKDGKPILTKLDEKTLEEIASVTGGTYTRAENGRDNLATVFRSIEKMEKKEFGARQFTEFEDRFQYPLGFGMLLLVVEVVLSERRNRFLSRFAIFRASDMEEA